jgi:hypothetical protein
MKKITLIGMATLMLGISTINTGCMGSYTLTKKLYGWNEHATGNTIVNTGVFWILCWNVYFIFLAVDTIVLNTIQFWTGSNPAAMAPGEREQQLVQGNDGNQYQITATQNRFDILPMTGSEKGNVLSLIYTPTNKSWSSLKDGKMQTLAALHPELNKVELFGKDGSVKMVDMASVFVNSLNH